MKPLKVAPVVAFFSVSALHSSSAQLDTRSNAVARSEIAIGGGLASFDMSVPAIGWVDHPYSDARTTRSRIDARFATASTLRGMDGAVTYSPAALQRFGLEYSYRVRVFHYADVQPLRSVTQSL